MKNYSKKNMITAVILSAVIASSFTFVLTGTSVKNLIDANSAYNCDVNNDKKVNVADLNIVKNTILKSEHVSESDEDETLTVLCHNFDDILSMKDYFCRITETDPEKINIVNFNTSSLEAPEMYLEYLSDPENDADLIFLDSEWCQQFICDNSLTLPLSDLGYSDNDFDNLYDYIVETGRSSKSGELKAISWQACPGAYCYREDMAKHYLNVTSPEEMQKYVCDWDTFTETARTIKENNGPALSATLNGVLKPLSFSRKTPWLDKDNTFIADDHFYNVLKISDELWSNGYITKVDQWSDEWCPLGESEDCMGFFIPSWGFDETILERAAGGPEGATFGSWKCTEGPEAFYWGGTWVAPSARINTPELAAKFIDTFTLNETTALEYAESENIFMSNRNVIKKLKYSAYHSKAPVLGGQDQFDILDKTAEKIDLKGKITPYDSDIENEFTSEIRSYCYGIISNEEETMQYFKDTITQNPDNVIKFK